MERIHRTDIPCPALAEASAPDSFFLEGTLASLSAPCLAVVGSRRASAEALRFAFLVARDLARRGYTIVSGLARGVDTAAHAGALAGDGATIAVLGSALDVLYPPENRALAASIAARGGALLTEHPPGTEPRPWHFPRRNRWIAALAGGVVVIEAGERSGSLSTAQAALALGRDVFVAPGNAADERYRGSHRLLQEGAKLVVEAQDVIDELPGHLVLQGAPRFPIAEPDWAKLATAFAQNSQVASASELADVLGRSTAAVANLLRRAQELGLVQALPMRRYLWVGTSEEEERGVRLAKAESFPAQ